MIEPHVDTHPDDYPKIFPAVGVVKHVACKDDPRNEWGEMTLYDVTVHLQHPPTSFDIELIPYLGQQAGEGNESEDPLLVGQRVEVAFMEGDENRPHITKTFPSNKPTIGQTAAEHPHVRHKRNGALAEVDKEGNVSLTLAAQKNFTLKDSDGNVLLRLYWTGSDYEIQLGGDSGLTRLMTEHTVAALRNLWTLATPAPNDGGLAIKNYFIASLDASFTNANTTSKTKAK